MAFDGPTDSSEIESLRAEITRLREELERAQPDFEFLGEAIPGGLRSQLIAGGKLSARAATTRRIGMHGDGGNLWLQVTEGGRSWLFRYRLAGRQREMGLGALRDTPLAEARAKAFICRGLIKKGVDPIARRQAFTAAAPAYKGTTFRQAAERYYESKKAGWRSEKHSIQFTGTMRDYVYPVFGDWRVADVDTDAVMRVLEPIWRVKPETAARVRSRVELVLGYATALKMRSGPNPAAWRGHLQALLPARGKVRRVKHHAALPFAEMHGFWMALAERTSISAEALRFTILTAARTGEVIGARWSEIDFATKAWIVPGERMKAGKEHRVPLSAEALQILQRMALLKTSVAGFIFPGAKPGKPLSQMSMTQVLRKLGRGDLTTHGMRSSFRDWASETTSYPNEMVEMALAHVIGNKAEAAYRRGDQFTKRGRLMSDWAAHCLTPPPTGNVVAIGSGR